MFTRNEKAERQGGPSFQECTAFFRKFQMVEAIVGVKVHTSSLGQY